MSRKTEQISVRLTAGQKERILAVAAEIGNDGSVTAGLRWCLRHAPIEKLGMQRGRGGKRGKNK